MLSVIPRWFCASGARLAGHDPSHLPAWSLSFLPKCNIVEVDEPMAMECRGWLRLWRLLGKRMSKNVRRMCRFCMKEISVWFVMDVFGETVTGDDFYVIRGSNEFETLWLCRNVASSAYFIWFLKRSFCMIIKRQRRGCNLVFAKNTIQ